MVRLHIQFRSEGLPFDFDAGEFACREDASAVASMIERETEEAAAGGEDVEFCGAEIVEMASC